MRTSNTYRHERREAVKKAAREDGVRLHEMWRGTRLNLTYKDPLVHKPARGTGRAYQPNGKREVARRIRQAERLAS